MFLINNYITISKEFLGEINYFIFGNLRDTVYALNFLFPVYFVNKGIHEHISTSTITLQQLEAITLVVINDAGQQVIRKIAFLQFVDLKKHQVFYLFHTLALFRSTQQEESTMIVHQF